ncbi:PREDICTED: transcription initiation factor TFIID subunit 15 [Tarenaya hassleriana]|uniref:transcription initiation factor TFIID subunit 15 n=1 Tax=Tarenaya hassleriana TaxID=28532 RepID=UPI00053C71CF|nr:PREDICTED: transcription initiation factor TFIID subunit 15 [Tarenaya hassleriana]
MNRPGDWNCRSCHHLNFQRRDTCQRCNEPRPGSGGADFAGGFGGRYGGGGGSSFGFNTGPDVRPGDWYCSVGSCGAHNFASRSSCFKCGASKDESSGSNSAFDGGDRTRRGFFGFGSGSDAHCIIRRAGCNEHNFASRTECFRCNAPKEPGSKPSY